jgi:hypothetical protein
MLSNFDPYDVLQQHEQTINDLINAHNEVARLAENLSESVVILNNKIDKLENFVLKNINETK